MSIRLNRVLISDNVDKKCEDLLRQKKIEVVSKTNLSPAELIQELEVRKFVTYQFKIFYMTIANFFLILETKLWKNCKF